MKDQAQAKVLTQAKPILSVQTAVIAFAAIAGIAIISIAGHVQATTLHDAAHDVRHATGFPCH